jgi:hypothetical protein
VGTFYTLGLQVKTFDFSLDDGGVARRYPLGGITVELRLLLFVPCLRWRVWFSCTFCLSFICRVRGSPHHLVSVWPYVALLIKRGEILFRGGVYMWKNLANVQYQMVIIWKFISYILIISINMLF